MRLKDPKLKDKILKVATKLVEKKGWEKLSIREIATKVKSSVGTIYNYYESQDEIILAINTQTLQTLLKTFQDEICGCSCAKTRIKKIGHAYINFSLENYRFWSMLFEYRLSNRPDTDTPNWYRKHIQEIFELIEDQVYKLIKCKPSQTQKYANLLWSNLHGLAILYHSGRINKLQNIDIQEQTELSLDNYLKGIK